MEIQRWNFWAGPSCDGADLEDKCGLIRNDEGYWVEYSDYEKALATLRSENELLKAKVSDEEWNSIWHSSARDFADKLIERRTQATQKG